MKTQLRKHSKKNVKNYSRKNTIHKMRGSARTSLFSKLSSSLSTRIEKISKDTKHLLPSDTETYIKKCKNKVYYMAIEFEKDSMLESIFDNTFAGCNSLVSIKIPKSTTLIGQGAFANCIYLTTVEFEIGSILERISNNTFAGCTSLVSIKIPKTTKYIGDSAFLGCSKLTKVIFEDGGILDEIHDNAFKDCKTLENIRILNTVKRIGENAFNNCKTLQHVVFQPDSVLKSIGADAFKDCRSLVGVIVHNKLTHTVIDGNIFVGCSKLSIRYDINTLLESLRDGDPDYDDHEDEHEDEDEDRDRDEVEYANAIEHKFFLDRNESEKTALEKKKEAEQKLLLHPLLTNPESLELVKKHIKPLHDGYIEACNFVNGYDKTTTNYLESNKIQIGYSYSGFYGKAPLYLNLSNPNQSFNDLLVYIDKNKTSVPVIHIERISNKFKNFTVGKGANQAVIDFFSDYLKTEYMKDITVKTCAKETRNTQNTNNTNTLQLSNATTLSESTNTEEEEGNDTSDYVMIKPKHAKHVNNVTISSSSSNTEEGKDNFVMINTKNSKKSSNLKRKLSNKKPNNRKKANDESELEFDLNIKIFDIDVLKSKKKLNNLSKVLHFFMFVMSPLYEMDFILNLNLSEFTLMMLFDMFKDIGVKKRLSVFIQEDIIDILNADEQIDQTSKYINNKKDHYTLNNITHKNTNTKDTKYRHNIDAIIYTYIGILFSLNEDQSSENINLFINSINTDYIQFPIEILLELLNKQLYGKTDIDLKTPIKEQYEKIKKDIKILEKLSAKIKIRFGCKSNDTTCFTDDDTKLTLNELTRTLIYNNTDIDKTNFIRLLRFKDNNINDESFEDSKNILIEILNSYTDNDLRHFIRFSTGSIHMADDINIAFSNSSDLFITARACIKTLFIWSFKGYKAHNTEGTTKEQYKEALQMQLQYTIKDNKFEMSGGGNRKKEK